MRVLIFLCLIIPFQASSQKADIDSLKNLINSSNSDSSKVKLYKEIALAYENVDLDSSRYYALIGYEMSDQIGFNQGSLTHLSQLVFLDYRQGNLERGLNYAHEALNLAEKINDQDNISRFLNMLRF